MKAFLLVLILCLPTCAPVRWTYVQDTGSSLPVYTICAPPDLPHRQEIGEAVQAWRYSVRGWREIDFTTDTRCSLRIDVVPGNPCQTPDALACVNALGGDQVWLLAGRWDIDPRGIVLHEIGHALGAQHLAGTLMGARNSPGRYSCPDRETIVQVAAYQHAPLYEFSWCYR